MYLFDPMRKSEWTDEIILERVERWCHDKGICGFYRMRSKSLFTLFISRSDTFSPSIGRGHMLYGTQMVREYKLDIDKLQRVFAQENRVSGERCHIGTIQIRPGIEFGANYEKSAGTIPVAPFQVEDKSGCIIYSHGKKWSRNRRWAITMALPDNSYHESGDVISLNRDLTELGFLSVDEFRRWCNHVTAP